MKKIFVAFFLLFAGANISNAAEELSINVDGVSADKPVPEKYARCVAKPDSKSGEGQNTNPGISWLKGPDGTKSYAIVVVDRDVPVNRESANQEGKTIDEYAPRQNFYHWLLLNIPANILAVPEGHGRDKSYGDQLVNDFFAASGLKRNDQNLMKFVGYDGPCPPWNDERLHNYHFKVYALSERFTLPEEYTGDEVMHKIAPYVLATGEVVGTYTLNPKLNPTLGKPAEPAKTESPKNAGKK